MTTGSNLYRTIVVDPPWAYPETGGRGGTDMHYRNMTHADLLALPVGQWAEPDQAHLYLWTTNAFLVQAHELAAAWGFEQKTVLTWVKSPGIGIGHYYRNTTEHVLFCTRGNLHLLRRDLKTHFIAPRTRHSAKPAAFYDLVESASPGPYLDVFSRTQRMGWDTYGLECFTPTELQRYLPIQ